MQLASNYRPAETISEKKTAAESVDRFRRGHLHRFFALVAWQKASPAPAWRRRFSSEVLLHTVAARLRGLVVPG